MDYLVGANIPPSKHIMHMGNHTIPKTPKHSSLGTEQKGIGGCSRQRIHCESYYMAATLFQCTMVCSWELGPQKGSSSHKHISLNWTILGHVPLSILLIYSNIYHQRMTRETNKKIHLHTCSHSPTTHTHRSPCPYTQMLVWRYEGETS